MDINSSMNGALDVWMIKTLFCDGVHKIKMGKSDKFSKDREMKKYYNISDDINDQIDYQSMDIYNVYEKCCTKWTSLEIY